MDYVFTLSEKMIFLELTLEGGGSPKYSQRPQSSSGSVGLRTTYSLERREVNTDKADIRRRGQAPRSLCEALLLNISTNHNPSHLGSLISCQHTFVSGLTRAQEGYNYSNLVNG